MAVATRLTLAARMMVAYGQAEDFAIHQWGEQCQAAERLAADTRMNGPSAPYGRAIMLREFWHDQAERCDAIVRALAAIL